MLFTWLRFLQRPQRTATGFGAILLNADGISCAKITGQPEAEETQLVCRFVPCDEASMERTLFDLVSEFQLERTHFSVVLSPHEYRMLQTTTPDVPEEEIRGAVRWRIQESIDFPAEEAELEYFPMPGSSQPGRLPAISVVVVHQTVVKRYTDLCEKAGLQLSVIDIPELALRNIATRNPENDRGLAYLYFFESGGVVVVQRQGLIHLHRELDLGSAQIIKELEQSAEFDRSPLLDRLALEVRRTLDYYESYFGLPPIVGLVVAPIASKTSELVAYLNGSLGVMARAMDVSALFRCPQRPDDATQQRCLPSVGALLRPRG